MPVTGGAGYIGSHTLLALVDADWRVAVLGEIKPLTEYDPLQPVNPYGMSKPMTERILADVSKAPAMNHSVLHYFDLCGADSQARSILAQGRYSAAV